MCLNIFHIGNKNKKPSDINVCVYTSKKQLVLKEFKQTS